MRRLLATLACDLRLQYRHGILLAAAGAALVWVLALLRVPDAVLDRRLPAFLLAHLLPVAFYLTAAQVIREKAEGSLAMRDASPLRPHEYLAAKALLGSLLSVAAGLAIALVVRGPVFRPLLLVLGAAAAGTLLVFAAFLAVSLRPAWKGFLPSSLLWVAACLPPFLPALGLGDGPLLRLHPLDGAMTLLRAAFTGAGTGEIAYGLAASAAWALVGLRACKGACERLRQAGE
jgi:fluoroquinolone transport system permease protein